MKRVIGIVGGSISGNKGAEAMTTTVVGLLHRAMPEAEFLIFSPYYRADKPLEGRYPRTTVVDGSPAALVTRTFTPVVLERLLGWTGLRPTNWAGPSREISRCDALVDLAGISFCDGREIYLPFNVLTILPAMMQDVPVIKLAQAMGPFRHRLNRCCARWLLPRCRRLVARGAETAENLKTIGLDAPIGPDVAFALNDLADMTCRPPKFQRLLAGDESRPWVGLSPSSVVLKNCRKLGIDYVGILAEFVRVVMAKGYRVLLLPHSIRPGTDRLKNNDLPVVRAVGQRVGSCDSMTLVTDDLDAIELRQLIGQCRLFLASRFHGMVAALAMAVPVAVCGWGHKYFETLDMFGQRKYAIDYRGLTLDGLLELFERLSANRESCRERILQSLPGVLDDARRQIAEIVSLVSAEGNGTRA